MQQNSTGLSRVLATSYWFALSAQQTKFATTPALRDSTSSDMGNATWDDVPLTRRCSIVWEVHLRAAAEKLFLNAVGLIAFHNHLSLCDLYLVQADWAEFMASLQPSKNHVGCWRAATFAFEHVVIGWLKGLNSCLSFWHFRQRLAIFMRGT